MGQAIGGALPLAIGVALSPVAIIAVVLMLTTEKARANGPAFEEPAADDRRCGGHRADRDLRRPAGDRLCGLRGLGTIGVAVPVVIYFAMCNRSADVLGHLKDWMGRHNAVIMAQI